MAARSGASPQVVALLFVLLLAGGECGRISEQAAVMNVAQDLIASQQLLSRQSAKGADGIFWWHNDVCRSREMNSIDPSMATQRYIQKYERLEALTVELQADKCSRGCASKWLELKSRVTHFSSCSAISQKVDEAEEEETPTISNLIKQMTSKNTSLMKVFADSLAAVGSAMRKNNMFPAGEKCSFFPSHLDVTTALEAKDPDEVGRVMREQLFGDKCDAAAAQEYLDALPDQAKRTATGTMAVVDRVVELARRMALTDADDHSEIKREVLDTAKDTRAIVEEAKRGDESTESQLADKKVEEQVEIKEASEEGSSSTSDSLIEMDATDKDSQPYGAGPGMEYYEPGAWRHGYSWWEFWVGLVIIIVVQAFVGTYCGPWIRELQASYYASQPFG